MSAIQRPARICDAHHHLWQHAGGYGCAEFRADLARVPEVASTVCVESRSWYREGGPEQLRPVGETEWIAREAVGLAQGIVGRADLRLGAAVEEVLSAHLEAGAGRFRGVRQLAAYDPSPELPRFPADHGPGLLGDARVREGLRVLRELGLCFETWVYFPQLPEVAELARALPDLPIVLDHLGGPVGVGPYAGRRGEVLARWRELLGEVAACPNVSLKLGGIGSPLCGNGWHLRPIRPDAREIAAVWGDAILDCIESFGVERCLFESNFPVDRASFDYASVWDAFAWITRGASHAERAALFHDNAARLYRLG
jgi:predicted TIM-barrel fold metal-dependent hydrolase